MWKEWFIAYLRHYPSICTELLKKSTKYLIMTAGFWAEVWTQDLQNTKH